jgi:hypothetical protein
LANVNLTQADADVLLAMEKGTEISGRFRCRQTCKGTYLEGDAYWFRGRRLLVRATAQDFSLRKYNLVQAILAVNDLRIRPHVRLRRAGI